MSRAGDALRPIGERPGAWLGRTLGLTTVAYLLLLGLVGLRLGTLPNYATLYPWFANIWRILSRTPSWHDSLGLIAEEPVFETGHRMATFPVSEWTLTVKPAELIAIAGAAGLAAAITLLQGRHRPLCVTGTGIGMSLASLPSLSFGWIACCGSSSWAVILSLLGLSTPAAFALEPFGVALLIGGYLLLIAVLLVEADRFHDRHHA